MQNLSFNRVICCALNYVYALAADKYLTEFFSKLKCKFGCKKCSFLLTFIG